MADGFFSNPDTPGEKAHPEARQEHERQIGVLETLLSTLQTESDPQKRDVIARDHLKQVGSNFAFGDHYTDRLLQNCPNPFFEKVAPFYIHYKSIYPEMFADQWARFAEKVTPQVAGMFVEGLKPVHIAAMKDLAGKLRDMAPDAYVRKMTPYYTNGKMKLSM